MPKGFFWTDQVKTCKDINQAWEILENEFANKRKLMDKLLAEINNLKQVKRDTKSLARYATAISVYVNDMENNGCSVSEASEVPFFMSQLLSKLDPRDDTNFGTEMQRARKDENVSNFITWLHQKTTLRSRGKRETDNAEDKERTNRGVRGIPLRWFKSYLSNRLQYVEFNGVSLESFEIKCGVPQGSILGPLLFLLYINDLCNVSKVVDFILFADDTNIFLSHKDFNLLPGILNSGMLKLTHWCRANKLSINFKKSKFMVFRPPQRRQTLDISIQIDNNAIKRVKETVFLGVILDEHLSWKPHILSVSRKISKSTGIIYKSSFCLPKTSLRSLYYSL